MTDYSSWLTKHQAARALKVSTKTLERMLQEGVRIQRALWQRNGRGPKLAVYHPDDVATAAKARGALPATFLMPADQASSPAAQEAGIAPLAMLGGDVPLERLVSWMATVSQTMSQMSQTPQTKWVTLLEAEPLSGLSKRALRQEIRAGRLTSLRSRGETMVLREAVTYRPRP